MFILVNIYFISEIEGQISNSFLERFLWEDPRSNNNEDPRDWTLLELFSQLQSLQKWREEAEKQQKMIRRI